MLVHELNIGCSRTSTMICNTIELMAERRGKEYERDLKIVISKMLCLLDTSGVFQKKCVLLLKKSAGNSLKTVK